MQFIVKCEVTAAKDGDRPSILMHIEYETTMVPTLVAKIPNFVVYLFVNFFWKHYYYDNDLNTIVAQPYYYW